MKKALVTGGHGFIASHLAKGLLAEGVEVRVLDRPGPRLTESGGPRHSGLDLLGIRGEIELVEGDLLEPAQVDGAVAGCDAVFHLGGRTFPGVTGPPPAQTFEINVRGAWNVFEACRVHSVERTVFASSPRAYGSSHELPYREDLPLQATYPYDASKAAAETIARSYADAYGVPIAVTRIANVYGPADVTFTRLVPATAIAVIEGRAPRIRSDGSPRRNFLHIDDAVSAYLAIAAALGREQAVGEAFNAADDHPHSVREVVDLIVELAGGDVTAEYGPGLLAGESRDQYLDSSKLTAMTGWRPAVDLRDGLLRTLEWYRDHREVRP
ncbi:MAG TPA: NAD(P)-dependent oxidoreductase [Solirubrobacterales bacterium]|nr:NAD(P)-dependent oxidoreductase [Solirubrobacterales bacterium]